MISTKAAAAVIRVPLAILKWGLMSSFFQSVQAIERQPKVNALYIYKMKGQYTYICIYICMHTYTY